RTWPRCRGACSAHRRAAGRAPRTSAEETSEATRETAEPVAGGGGRLLHGLTDRGHHEVFEHLDVFGVDDFRGDLHLQELLAPGDRGGDQTTTGRARELLLRQLGLGGHHLLLHL